MNPEALLFAGQGSQYVGMMRDLTAAFPAAQERLGRADDILGFALSEICFDGPEERLKETRYTQPALFVHEAILVDQLRGRLNFSAVAGHSLGEYSALYAAGVLDFEAALKLVQLRGDLMFRAGEDSPGTMLAVLGLPDEKVIGLCEELQDGEHVIVAANFNAPGQVVVSGSADYLRDKQEKFKEAGARRVMEVKVSGAFHSPLMESARQTLATAIDNVAFNDAAVDVYCNSRAAALRSASDLREALVEQLVSPVLWTQSLNAMYAAGIRSFVEIGPGKILQGMLKRTLTDVEISGVDTAEQLNSFRQA